MLNFKNSSGAGALSLINEAFINSLAISLLLLLFHGLFTLNEKSVCLTNLSTEINWIWKQLFVNHSWLIEKHSCNCWCVFFSICIQNYLINVISNEIFSVFTLQTVKNWNINLRELQMSLNINLLLDKWLRHASLRSGFRIKFTKLLLIVWSLLLILSIVLVLLISILTSASSPVVVTSSSISSLISSIVILSLPASLALVHIPWLELLLLPMILLTLNILSWVWMSKSVLKPLWFIY